MHKKKVLTVVILVLAAVALVVIPSSAQDSLSLSGTTGYHTYAVKSHEFLQGGPGTPGIPAEAELHYLGGQAVELVLTEYVPGATRTTPLAGKLSAGGQIKLWYPEPIIPGTDFTIIDIVEMHTGCDVLGGTFPVFHGYMDGGRLYASTHFNSRCDQEWEPNPLFPEPVFDLPIEGPVQWEWTIDLTVD
jgi:hypothetical protein